MALGLITSLTGVMHRRPADECMELVLPDREKALFPCVPSRWFYWFRWRLLGLIPHPFIAKDPSSHYTHLCTDIKSNSLDIGTHDKTDKPFRDVVWLLAHHFYDTQELLDAYRPSVEFIILAEPCLLQSCHRLLKLTMIGE